MRILVLILSLMSWFHASPVQADTLADLKQKAASIAYADGTLKFGLAIERLGQSLYRYGLASPNERSLGMVLPIMRMPVPANPKPDKIDYQAFRQILVTLVADLDAAEAALASAGDVDAKLPVNLATIGFDFNRDGTRTPEEMLPVLMANLMGANMTPTTNFTVNFDTADIYWLRGYGRFISSFAQFLLAHDFEVTFNKTFHLFFPQSGLPLGDVLRADSAGTGMFTGSGQGDGEIADSIALFHLINWKTADASKLSDVRLRLRAMADLSPKSWAAARAETDNDKEWLPNARQTQAITGTANSDAVIDGWLAVMAEFGDILDGKKLMPHWRFAKGMNVKRFFEESGNFDLVLAITGTDAVPYLEQGLVSDSTRWNDLMRVFEGNFLGYAVWYN